jgi:hypothetical protein
LLLSFLISKADFKNILGHVLGQITNERKGDKDIKEEKKLIINTLVKL